MADMYPALVIAHSWVRWLVLLTAVLALARAISGRAGRRDWLPADNAAGRWFVLTLDVQVMLGLVIYLFLSPSTMSAWRQMADAMKDPLLRFMAVEHPVGILVATALAHIGRARIRKAAAPARRHTLALIFFGLALLVMLVSIPWPFMAVGRPLFRGL
jgi:hypothetical protein